MHKSNKFSHDFIQSWKKNWPTHILLAERNETIIMEIAEKCARVAKVDMDEESGYYKIMAAIGSIAAFCERSKNWRDKNMYQINQALESVLIEMIAEKKARQEAQYEQTAADRSNRFAQQERAQVEKDMEKGRLKAKHWYENEMTAEEKADYEAWKKKVEMGRIIYMELAKQKSVNKAL